MRVLVTGATGFVGARTVAACRRAGCEVGALALPAEAAGCRERLGEDVTVFAGSLASPPWEDLAAWQPDACIHCAWIATPGEYLESPLNLDFLAWSKVFLQRLADLGTRRLVGVGSCAESLVATRGLEAPLYARCKDELGRFVAAGIGGSSCAWARLYYPYGIGEHPDRLPSAVCRSLLAGKQFHLRSPGAVKDYIHIEDVAAALHALVAVPAAGCFEIGTGVPVPIGQLAGQLAEQVGRPDLLVLGDEPDRLGRQLADPQPLARLGWRSLRPLATGLGELAAYWAESFRP
jgi:nucleoside-diphosphate-sugar epimerase